MEHTHRQKALLAFAAAALFSAASAVPAAGSDRAAAPDLTPAVGGGGERPVAVLKAETLNFFFDDLDGLLGAPVVDRRNKESGKVIELIVEQDGSVSAMIVAVSLDRPRSSMAGTAGAAFVAATETYVRRKAPTHDLKVIETLSGGKMVRVKDHIADLSVFPKFTPKSADD